MSEPENKDKIKEILEGHNKKFTPLELIVGIIVILIIGSGIGYAIFKLLTPSPTTPPRAITEIQQPQIPPMNEEENSSVEQPKVKTSTEKQLESVENKTGETTNVATTSPAPQPAAESEKEEQKGGKTQKDVGMESTASNETEANTSAVSEQAGPKIIPPKSEIEQGEKLEKRVKSGIHKSAAKVKKGVKNTLKKKIEKNRRALAIYKSKESSHRVKLQRKSHAGVYILQVSSNKNRKLAILTVIKLRKCGHKAYTREVEINGEKYTRVYVGPIKGYSAARLEAKEIKRQLHLGYLPIIKRND